MSSSANDAERERLMLLANELSSIVERLEELKRRVVTRALA